MHGSPLQAPMANRLPDGLSAEQLRRSLEGIPSTLNGMRSPLGEPVRSESVAGMDMLNDMFQRQARRLESQLYQRAQDMRTIELTQRQAALARNQVRQLEQHHLEQAARISQGAKSLQRLQDLIRESIASNNAALALCDALEKDGGALKGELQRAAPDVLSSLRLHAGEHGTVEQLKQRAAALDSALGETERSAMQQIGVTPLTSVAMSSDCNPLNDLSAVADYASKASVGAGGDSSSSRPQRPPSAGAPSALSAMPTSLVGGMPPAEAPAPAPSCMTVSMPGMNGMPPSSVMGGLTGQASPMQLSPAGSRADLSGMGGSLSASGGQYGGSGGVGVHGSVGASGLNLLAGAGISGANMGGSAVLSGHGGVAGGVLGGGCGGGAYSAAAAGGGMPPQRPIGTMGLGGTSYGAGGYGGGQCGGGCASVACGSSTSGSISAAGSSDAPAHAAMTAAALIGAHRHAQQ